MAFSAEYIYRIIDRYSRPIEKITRHTERFSKSVEQAQNRAKQMTGGLRDLGTKMTAGLTLPLTGIGLVAAKTAIDFQDAFTGVKKTVTATPEQLAKMNEQFKKMSTEIPISATALMGIGESAGQLGIHTNNITKFAKTIGMLAATTNLTAEEGAMSLAQFANITQMSQDDFDKLGSTIVHLGNNMATNEGKIVSMAMRLASAGKIVRMNQSQIMAMAATLSSLGIEAEAGGTAFSKVMLDMNDAVSKGGKNLTIMAKVAGSKSIQAFRDMFKTDAATAIRNFVEGLGRMDKEGKNVNAVLGKLGMQEVRMRNALLSAAGAGDLFSKAIAMASDAWRDNNALTNEARLRFATWSSQLKIVWNKLMLLANDMGSLIVPIFIKFLNLLIPISKLFMKLPNFIKYMIIGIGGLVAAIGPLLLGLSVLLPALMTLKTVILPWIIGTGLPAMIAGLWSFMAATWPIWLVVAALAAAAFVLKKAYDNSAMLRQSFKNLRDSLQPAIDSFAELLVMLGVGGVSKAMDDTTKSADKMYNSWKVIGDAISVAVDGLAAFIKSTTELTQESGKFLGALSVGEFKDAWNILSGKGSKFDVGEQAARDKARSRTDNEVKVSGQIGVSATGNAKVETANINLNQGSNIAMMAAH